ncbi:hypothetical protein [Hydrogenimonas sp.]
MSIKEQVEYAKEELTQDEKLLAGLIKAERFYKRNKMLILGLAGIVVAGGLGYAVMDYMKEQRLLRANEALLTLQKNPDDKAALQTLESENPQLAALFELSRAVQRGDAATLKKLESNPDSVVKDLATYHAAALKRDRKALNSYRMKSEALVKDFALFDEAYLLIESGDIAKAHDLLALVPEGSPLRPAATMLAHYGVAAAKGGE